MTRLLVHAATFQLLISFKWRRPPASQRISCCEVLGFAVVGFMLGWLALQWGC